MYVAFDTGFLSREQAIHVDTSRKRSALETTMKLPPGHFLFHQGDEGQTIYRVTEGVLRLSRVSEKGRQQVVAFGYPGDIVGFPVAGQRNTDCDALTTAKVQVLPARLPRDGSGGMAEAAFLAAAALLEIGNMQEHLMTLGRKSSRERVSSFLLVLMRRVGRHDRDAIHVDLPMSRADIADFLGLRTETVSRAFTDLREARIIDLPTAQHVAVLDPDRLEEVAEAD